MAQFSKKPVIVEAITFAELIEFGIKSGATIVNGMPWSFNYRGCVVTHENDTLYLILTHSGYKNFTPTDMLVTESGGETSVCNVGIFKDEYEPV